MSGQLFMVNSTAGLSAGGSTAHWIDVTAASGSEVLLAEIGDLETLPSGEIAALARPVLPRATVQETIASAQYARLRRVALGSLDAVIMRTNPGRDQQAWRHDGGLIMLSHAQRRGVLVLNNPNTLLYARSKVYLSTLPAHTRPQTLVSRDVRSIRQFVREHGKSVVKPTVGTHGRDVFVLESESASNFSQVVEVVRREGFAMVQSFVPEAPEGDTRVLLVDGAPLVVDGRIAAVHRRPSAEDFRSNIHAGGRAEPADVTPAILQVVDDVGARLREDGLFLVGLDIIGDSIVEVNAFAPGGFEDASRFAGVDFMSALVDRVRERIDAYQEA